MVTFCVPSWGRKCQWRGVGGQKTNMLSMYFENLALIFKVLFSEKCVQFSFAPLIILIKNTKKKSISISDQSYTLDQMSNIKIQISNRVYPGKNLNMSFPVQIYKVSLTNLTILKLPGIFWQHYWYIHFQNHFASSCKVFFFKIISLQAQWKHMGTIGIWPNQRLLKSWLLKYVCTGF